MIKIFHQTLIPILTGFALFVCLPANASNHQPTLSFSFGEQSVNDIKVSESAGFIKITATLSEPSTEEVSFSFIQTVGSAEIFKDFSFPESITGDVAGNEKSATLVIEPGTQEIVFPLVLIRDDNLDELDETFFFLLRSNKGATLEQSSIKITILDNEETPVIVLSAPGLNRNEDGTLTTALNESDGGINLKLTLADDNNQSGFDTLVNYRIEQPEGANDASDLADYSIIADDGTKTSATEGTLRLPAEAPDASFLLAINDDQTRESDEVIIFTLLSAENESGANIHNTRNTIKVTIIDDDAKSGAINDTGVTRCYNDQQDPIACNDDTGFPGYDQDGDQINPSRYVKLDENGELLGDNANDPACIYDENTNLVWQAKTEGGAYTWLNKISSINGGSEGAQGSNIEGDGVSSGCQSPPCDTENYADELNTLSTETNNTTGLCNIRNWRLPKLRELMSIMNFEPDDSTALLLDGQYFSAIKTAYYWTSTPSALFPDSAWCIYFSKVENNHIKLCEKNTALPVRMVATCNPGTNPGNGPC